MAGGVCRLCDMKNNKRRLLLSTTQKDVNITPLHARLPLKIVKTGVVRHTTRSWLKIKHVLSKQAFNIYWMLLFLVLKPYILKLSWYVIPDNVVLSGWTYVFTWYPWLERRGAGRRLSSLTPSPCPPTVASARSSPWRPSLPTLLVMMVRV